MTYDPWAQTQPTQPRNSTSQQPLRASPPPEWMRQKKRKVGCGCGCGPFIGGMALAIAFFLFVYALAPFRTNLLLLGIDYTPIENAIGRSDTIMMATVLPLEPYIGTISIPRDLWVTIPGVGENRINTAHFFAEGQQAGRGPIAAMDTIQQNFGVKMDYFVRIRFDGFRSIVTALGGVEVVLDRPMAGYPVGKHYLTGRKALAFARSRLDSDDFFRMEQSQILIKSILRTLMIPSTWPRLPAVIFAASQNIDTNIPWWQWPRLGFALLRAGPEGIDSRKIDRNMVTPYTTDQGASVLLPDWSRINNEVAEVFGE